MSNMIGNLLKVKSIEKMWTYCWTKMAILLRRGVPAFGSVQKVVTPRRKNVQFLLRRK